MEVCLLMSRALEFQLQDHPWKNLCNCLKLDHRVWKIALDQDLAFWALICKEISWAKSTAWFWKDKTSLEGWELEKKPLNWKLNKLDMKTTEPQQTIPFIQHNFSTANPTLKATIHSIATKLLADNAFKRKKTLYWKTWSCLSFNSILLSFLYRFYDEDSRASQQCIAVSNISNICHKWFDASYHLHTHMESFVSVCTWRVNTAVHLWWRIQGIKKCVPATTWSTHFSAPSLQCPRAVLGELHTLPKQALSLPLCPTCCLRFLFKVWDLSVALHSGQQAR